MARCDLCGADCRVTDMVQLFDSYRLPGVVDLCPDCGKWAAKMKQDMLLEISARMRAAISERKGLPPPTPKKSWWRRLVVSL